MMASSITPDNGATGPCKQCGGLNGVCFLTCKSLRLPPGYRLSGEPE